MSNTAVIDKLRADRDSARDAAISMAEAEDFDPTSSAFGELEARAASLDSQIERLQNLLSAQESADALDGKFSKASKRSELKVRENNDDARSWGELFVRSEEFGNYRGRGQSAQYGIDFDRRQNRALPSGLSDLVAAGYTLGKTQVDNSAPAAPTPLLDAVNQVAVSGNSVEFVAWSKKAGGAAKVAEKAAKPSVEFGPTVVPSVLDTFAAYTQLTRQLIEDQSAVRDLIDNELRREVTRSIEADAAAKLAAATLPTASAADLLGAIRVGIATVQSAGYNPTAILINPVDWADLDNAVMGATLIGPQVRQSFWGLSVLPSSAQPAGTATVGDFKAGVSHFYRTQVQVYISDSHADTFLSNVFTLLGEARGLTAVVRPQALVEVAKV
jgi:HK97 family phage major capsid protein